MNIQTLTDGALAVTLSGKELYTIRQCLNEVCNGFRVADFKTRIGVEEPIALRLLDQTRISSKAKVAPIAGDAFRLTLAPEEARIFLNAMKETFRQGKGEGIPSREYQTRVGAKVEEVKAIISRIEAAMPS